MEARTEVHPPQFAVGLGDDEANSGVDPSPCARQRRAGPLHHVAEQGGTRCGHTLHRGERGAGEGLEPGHRVNVPFLHQLQRDLLEPYPVPHLLEERTLVRLARLGQTQRLRVVVVGSGEENVPRRRVHVGDGVQWRDQDRALPPGSESGCEQGFGQARAVVGVHAPFDRFRPPVGLLLPAPDEIGQDGARGVGVVDHHVGAVVRVHQWSLAFHDRSERWMFGDVSAYVGVVGGQ